MAKFHVWGSITYTRVVTVEAESGAEAELLAEDIDNDKWEVITAPWSIIHLGVDEAYKGDK